MTLSLSLFILCAVYTKAYLGDSMSEVSKQISAFCQSVAGWQILANVSLFYLTSSHHEHFQLPRCRSGTHWHTHCPKTWPRSRFSLHLASSEQYCWSGRRGILTELSLCCSLVLCSISAMHIAQSQWAVLSGWSTGSGFDLIGPRSQSSKHLCIFRLYGAM